MSNSIPYPVRDATPYLQLVDERAVYDAGEHFTRMDDDVVEEISAILGLSYIGLYTYLTRRVNATGQCAISYARIADDCHTSRRNIIRVAKKLADAGFITITTPPNARTDHLANTFTLPRHRVRTPSDRPSDEASDRPSDEASAPQSPKVDTSKDQVHPSRRTTPLTPQRVQEERFERFWSAFPRKVGKQPAWKAWLKLNPDDALTDRILAAIPVQQQSREWTKDGGQFIPHPTTWLNGQRWEDELTPATAVPARSNGTHRGKDVGYSLEELVAMARGER